MNVRPYQPGDCVQYRPGDQFSRGMHDVLMRHGSFVRTLEVDGEPVALFGLVVRWAGVAEVWAIISDDARGHGLALTRHARRLVRLFATELDLWRLSAVVRDDKPEYQRWLELLGFEYEGCEEFAAPDGTDLLRYRLIWAPPKDHPLQ